MSERKYKRTAFKAGDDVAIRMPKEYGFQPGEPLELRFDGRKITVHRLSLADKAISSEEI
jgi:urease accessory protein UreE